jgi:Predicted ester cyclase
MSVEAQNEAVIRRWIEEGWNQKKPELVDELMAEDVVAHGMGPHGTDLSGRGAFRSAYDIFVSVFPDLHLTIDHMMSSGEMVASHMTCEATHAGDALGVPGSGARVRFPVMTMARVQDGRITEGWNVIDLLAALQQAKAVQVSTALP